VSCGGDECSDGNECGGGDEHSGGDVRSCGGDECGGGDERGGGNERGGGGGGDERGGGGDKRGGSAERTAETFDGGMAAAAMGVGSSFSSTSHLLLGRDGRPRLVGLGGRDETPPLGELSLGRLASALLGWGRLDTV
jgi:hypothetical protein